MSSKTVSSMDAATEPIGIYRPASAVDKARSGLAIRLHAFVGRSRYRGDKPRVAMSTRIVAKCIRHDLGEILYNLMHNPQQVQSSVGRAIDYLSRNAYRAHPKRDRKTGRLKLGLEHVYAGA